MIDVYGDQEFGAGTGNVDGKLGFPDWSGYRFLRDYPDLDADLEKLGHLIQKFLCQFRPHDCWALSYVGTCSEPRVDASGGGAVFVTSHRITFDNSWDLIERKRPTFANGAGNNAGYPHSRRGPSAVDGSHGNQLRTATVVSTGW
jgi:hypothetical protein